jgi:hypothetical protein
VHTLLNAIYTEDLLVLLVLPATDHSRATRQIRNRIKYHRKVRAGDLVPHELNYRLHLERQRAA